VKRFCTAARSGQGRDRQGAASSEPLPASTAVQSTDVDGWGGGHPAGELRADFRELLWRPVCEAAVWPICVIFLTPAFDLALRVCQVQEPTRIQALITQVTVKAFHMSVGFR
jgi:hypothetical protein